MTMAVTLRRPDDEAFAPFGAFIEPPSEVGLQSAFSGWLEPVPGASQHGYLNRVAPVALPVTVTRVERHPHAAQLFLPVGVARYLVTVMPPDETGAPDPTRALAFVVPGTVGVAYRPGTWHTGISVLDAEGSFAVMMWRGREEDDVFAQIAPIEVRMPHDVTGRVTRG
jgi:ureidoglycolate lyase